MPHLSEKSKSGRILDNSENSPRYLNFSEHVLGDPPPETCLSEAPDKTFKGGVPDGSNKGQVADSDFMYNMFSIVQLLESDTELSVRPLFTCI